MANFNSKIINLANFWPRWYVFFMWSRLKSYDPISLKPHFAAPQTTFLSASSGRWPSPAVSYLTSMNRSPEKPSHGQALDYAACDEVRALSGGNDWDEAGRPLSDIIASRATVRITTSGSLGFEREEHTQLFEVLPVVMEEAAPCFFSELEERRIWFPSTLPYFLWNSERLILRCLCRRVSESERLRCPECCHRPFKQECH